MVNFIELQDKFNDKFYFRIIADSYPDIVLWNNQEYIVNRNRFFNTKYGFVNIYDSPIGSLAIKFIHSKFHKEAYKEIQDNLKLETSLKNGKNKKCNQLFTTLLGFDVINNYFLLVFKALPYNVYEFLKKHELRSFTMAITLLQDISYALLCLSNMKYVYGDIKPENILVDTRGHFSLIDFDTLQELKSRKVKNHMYTTGYQSLDRIKTQQIAISDDIWSLSVVLYQFVTGAEDGLWDKETDFTYENYKLAIHNIASRTRHWSKMEQIEIIRLFTMMNKYNEKDRVKIQKLVQILNP
jgi:serine/threonine protein kinase